MKRGVARPGLHAEGSRASPGCRRVKGGGERRDGACAFEARWAGVGLVDQREQEADPSPPPRDQVPPRRHVPGPRRGDQGQESQGLGSGRGGPRTRGAGGRAGWEGWSHLDLQEFNPGQGTWRFTGNVCAVGPRRSPRPSRTTRAPRNVPAAGTRQALRTRRLPSRLGAPRRGHSPVSGGVLSGHRGQQRISRGTIPGKGPTGTELLGRDRVPPGAG